MAEGDGAGQAMLAAWLAGWTHLAAAIAAAAEGFAARSGDSDAADALWTQCEAQFGIWRAQARGLAATAHSAAGRETLDRFLDPAQWLFGGAAAPDPALVALIAGAERDAPGGFGRETLRTTPEWAALRRARARHRALVAGAWKRCFERLAADPAAIASVEALQDRWLAAAMTELDALHADPAFLDSMRDLVMAAVSLREAEARLVEAFCEAHALPTRREVDDLHRTVTELRRELRALKRRPGGEADAPDRGKA